MYPLPIPRFKLGWYVFWRLFGVVFSTVAIPQDNISDVIAGPYMTNDPINCELLTGDVGRAFASVTNRIAARFQQLNLCRTCAVFALLLLHHLGWYLGCACCSVDRDRDLDASLVYRDSSRLNGYDTEGSDCSWEQFVACGVGHCVRGSRRVCIEWWLVNEDHVARCKHGFDPD